MVVDSIKVSAATESLGLNDGFSLMPNTLHYKFQRSSGTDFEPCSAFFLMINNVNNSPQEFQDRKNANTLTSEKLSSICTPKNNRDRMIIDNSEV